MILTRWKIDFECRPINLCADSSGDWYRREDVDQLVERIKYFEAQLEGETQLCDEIDKLITDKDKLVERVKELEEQRAFMADANNTLRESKLEIMAENDQLKERIRLFEESDLPAEYALVTAERDRLKEEVSDMKEWIKKEKDYEVTRLTAELAEARKLLNEMVLLFELNSITTGQPEPRASKIIKEFLNRPRVLSSLNESQQ